MISAFATMLHRPRWAPGSLRRILLVKTDHLGDLLLCLPALRDFLATQPGASLGVVVGSANREIAERVPWIAETHVFDSPRYVRRGRPSPSRALDAILALDWDLVIDLTNDRAAALAALSRPSRHRRDLGTERIRMKLRGLLGRRGAVGAAHAACVFYRVLGLAPPEAVQPEPIALRPGDVANASAALARTWPGSRPIAAIHAGAIWEHRRWPVGRFAETARRLEGAGHAVIFVGGPNDVSVSREAARAAGLPESRVLAGALDLPSTAAVLERAAVLVANDGGLVHLAAAQGTPVVGIFGPQDPALFGPIGAKSAALYRRRDCSPCSQRHCIWGRARCLEPLEIEDVEREALRVARGGAPA